MNESFGGALSVDHVGRAAQLDQIVAQVLTREHATPQLIFVSADGGYGKTRMLTAVLDRLRAQPDPRLLCASDLVDLYHLEHHTPLGLANALYGVLTPPLHPLSRFRSEYDQLTRIRLSGDVIGVKEQQQRALDCFTEEIRSIAADRPVVMALDTVERACYQTLRGESNEAEQLQYAESWEWLLESLPRWGNVTVLAAGRPLIRTTLMPKALRQDDSVVVVDHELEGFNFGDTIEYLKAVQARAEQSGDAGVRGVAQLLREMPDEVQTKLFNASHGRPILLALCIDLATTHPQRFFTIEELNDLHDLEATIIRRIMETEGDLGAVVTALGRLPKGVTPALLAAAMECSVGEAQGFLERVRPLSFVKQRPADQKIFLHDEMYAMLRRHVYSEPSEVVAARDVYAAAVKHYDEQIKEIQARIDQVFADVDASRATPLDSMRLEQLYQQRSTLLVDVVYYRLAQLPARGFMRYYRYMREASYSADLLLDTQLILVLQEFWNENDPDGRVDRLGGIPRALVSSEILVRPVVRAAMGNRYQEASEAASAARKQLDREDRSGHTWATTRTAINFWEAYAQTLHGDPTGRANAERLLTEGIAALEHLLRQPEFAEIDVSEEDSSRIWSNESALVKWRAMAVRAMGHRVLGYHYRAGEEYQKAIAEYVKAIALWRTVNMRVELAYTQNDLGYVYGVLNQIDDAIDMATQALKNRRQIGFRDHIALSLNTLGLIELAEGQYPQAQGHCTQALAIFRALENRRGVGLALLALAEILRRGSAPEGKSAQERVSDLRKADQYNKEAIRIFDDLGEPLRQVEARIEAGCCLRDWLAVRRIHPDPGDDVRRLATESREYLEDAFERAHANDMLFHELDARSNLAWLDFVERKGRPEQIDYAPVKQAIAAALKQVPPEYRLNPASERPEIAPDRINRRLWTRVAKLHMLYGNLVFEQYRSSGDTFRDRLSRPEEAQNQIRQLAEQYLLALEYNHLYAPDFRDSRRVTTQIQEQLEPLDVSELQAIVQAVTNLEREWNLHSKVDSEGRGGSELRKLLMRRALWQGE